VRFAHRFAMRFGAHRRLLRQTKRPPGMPGGLFQGNLKPFMRFAIVNQALFAIDFIANCYSRKSPHWSFRNSSALLSAGQKDESPACGAFHLVHLSAC
jgi:hypothetical protein